MVFNWGDLMGQVQRDYEQLVVDLREFIEGKVEAGEPVVVIIEKSVSCWDKLKSRLGF